MKVKFNFDDESHIFELMDDLFVYMLKRELKNQKRELKNQKGMIYEWSTKEDIKITKSNIKAIKQLLSEYSYET